MFYKKNRIRIWLVLILVITCSLGTVAMAQTYIPTNRDTLAAPDKVTYDITDFSGYEFLYETDTVRYYFREDRDIFAIEDKRTGYTWKTGLDAGFKDEIKDAVKEAKTPEEALVAAEPIEQSLNSTYIGIANSLITVEYSDSETTKSISSASQEEVTSSLYTLNDNPATRRLDVDFTGIDLQMKVYITLKEDTITYDIKYEEITGAGKAVMTAVLITPFLGASGGVAEYYDEATGKYLDEVVKYKIPGYILVPDGSGCLIRFVDNTTEFTEYSGDVYGKDPAGEAYYYSEMSGAIPLKDPVMPVFGVAHGDGQAAFLAYADSGAEYMEIIVNPEESKRVLYNWVYPRFEYNTTYFQVYNKKGDGYFTLMEEPNQFDINMSYSFIAGDGSDGTPAADYTGMATVYRNHLLETGVLEATETEDNDLDIPIRLDFIMADSKKGIVGTEEVVVTTTDEVADILEVITDSGITNINSGLLGWQEDGETLSKPYQADYSGSIGSKSDFKELMKEFTKMGIDISYSRDFSSINRDMISYYNNAAKHINTWYLDLDLSVILPVNCPVVNYSYATPKRSAEWLLRLFDKIGSHGSSFTVTGISNTLVSTHDREGTVTSLKEAIALYQDAFTQIDDKVLLNLETPNLYLWEYTDRYLQAPVGGSQYIFETDTVPFLQMVLHGTMEVYAPYSNFSFYTQADILRMIDYNVSPAFILSKEPSYYLADTASSDLYSTEFEQYKTLISTIYGQVNEALSAVLGYDWKSRMVLKNGVILNSYQKGNESREILINYTDEAVTYQEVTVAPQSAKVIQ